MSSYAETACAHLRIHLKLRRIPMLSLPWGMSRSGIYDRFAGHPFPDLDLLQIALDALRIDPLDFYRGVVTGFDPEVFLWKRWLQSRAQKQRVARFRKHLVKPPTRTFRPAELRELAAGLESLRKTDPEAARRLALDIWRHPDLEDDVAGEAIGALGVLERFSDRTSNAAYCQTRALQLAGGSPRLKGRTLRRIAMLVFFNGEEADGALETLRRARLIYDEVSDDVRAAKTLVDQAVIHNNCGRHRQAWQAHDTGRSWRTAHKPGLRTWSRKASPINAR